MGISEYHSHPPAFPDFNYCLQLSLRQAQLFCLYTTHDFLRHLEHTCNLLAEEREVLIHQPCSFLILIFTLLLSLQNQEPQQSFGWDCRAVLSVLGD